MVAEIILLYIVIFFAAAIQGSVGFGLGLVALALLSFFFDLKDASIIISFSSLTLCVTALFKLRGNFEFKDLVPLILSSLLSIPIGVFLITVLPGKVLQLLFSIIMFVIVFYRIVSHRRSKAFHSYYLGIPCGVLSGLMTGVLGVGGPPVVAYISSLHKDKFKYVACVQGVLSISALFRVISLASFGAYTADRFFLALGGILSAFSGALTGVYILKYISSEVLGKIVICLLVMIALKNLFFAI